MPLPSEYPRVLVCVLTYNPGPVVLETIASLLRQSYPNMSLVVVDNASADGTEARVARAYPQVRFVGTGANLGFCGGTNYALALGIREGCDMVLVANPDIEVEADAVARLVVAAAADPGAALVGAREVDFHTGETRSVGGRGFNLWTARTRWLTAKEVEADPEKPFVADYVQGALVLYTRTALREGVRLDEDLFAYVDELDLGLRLKEIGMRARVHPGVRVRHKVRHGVRSPVEGYLILRNRCYLVRRHGRWYHQAFFFLHLGLVGLPHRCLSQCLRGRHRYARACALGFLDGLRGVVGPGRVGSL
ncbi:MAG: glycosyltransferase family 2 protein [Armatimonadetes bacterium]|nr:glycosyltransferase family 2 protein [Armatimonadota bacterium]